MKGWRIDLPIYDSRDNGAIYSLALPYYPNRGAQRFSDVVLIDGAAGYGYTLTEDPALPPQSFSRIEIEALMLGIGSLGTLGDADLARAGRDAIARIIATLPDGQARHRRTCPKWISCARP